MNTSLITVNERSSARYTFTVLDYDRVMIPKSQMSTLRLSVFEARSLTTVNGRNDQNVFDQNNVTIAADGTITWDVQPGDNIIVNPEYSQETHTVQFTLVVTGGKQHVHQTAIVVNNLAKVV